MMSRPLRILQLNAQAAGGGAAGIAGALVAGLGRAGVAARLVSGEGLPLRRWRRAWAALRRRWPHGLPARLLLHASAPVASLRRWRGLEARGACDQEAILAWARAADLVHLHNAHGDWLDPALLPRLAAGRPLVMTMHDAWLATGLCSQPGECRRWRSGCGACPQLSTRPELRRDASRANWRWKRDLLAAARPHLVVPSAWMEDVARTAFPWLGADRIHRIANGIDLGLFRPGDMAKARSALGLPSAVPVIAMVAHRPSVNIHRDWPTLRAALGRLEQPVHCLLVGEEADGGERIGQVVVHRLAHRAGADLVAAYHAADAVVHPAVADTFPTVVLEAMACARPVVATAVGGIPEQLAAGTGVLVQPGDAAGLAAAIAALLADRDRAAALGASARRRAEACYDRETMIAAHLRLYRDLLGRP